jgi:hypothetical protein
MESLALLHLTKKNIAMHPIQSISIPKPCHENWNQMTPVEQGRHCMQCSKTVTDFTAMTSSEIIDYFSNNGNVCGRFESHQLPALNNYLAIEDKPFFSWKKLAFAAAITTLFATANADAQRLLGRVKVSQSANYKKDVPVAHDTSDTTVTGTVIDNNDHLPLPGVEVRAKGTTIGAITNAKGEFTIKVPSNAGYLIVSLVGYESFEAKVSDFTNGTKCVSLKLNQMLLGEPAIVMKKQPLYKRVWHKIKGKS